MKVFKQRPEGSEGRTRQKSVAGACRTGRESAKALKCRVVLQEEEQEAWTAGVEGGRAREAEAQRGGTDCLSEGSWTQSGGPLGDWFLLCEVEITGGF